MLDHTQFDKLCEQAITNTTRMFYPRNLQFSPKFLQAFKEEYYRQKKTVTEEKGDKAFGSHFERMLKGLRFEARKLEDGNKPKIEAKKYPSGKAVAMSPSFSRRHVSKVRRELGEPDPMGDLRPRNPVTGEPTDREEREEARRFVDRMGLRPGIAKTRRGPLKLN